MSRVAIYLAGTIVKKHEACAAETRWGEEEIETLVNALSRYRVELLNPAERSDDLGDQKSVFGRDMLQVFSSDIVFVDARGRRGLGVGAEMMWAKMNAIPVVTLAPKNSHYNKLQTSVLGRELSEWVHPFVEFLSDGIVETVEEGALWIDDYLSGKRPLFIKDKAGIFEAMQYYKATNFLKDAPMINLKKISEPLSQRFETISRK